MPKQVQLMFELVVGNVGTVMETSNLVAAREDYFHYVGLSAKGIGRVAGEQVTLLLNGEPAISWDPDKRQHVWHCPPWPTDKLGHCSQ